jgi:hypothetical protein
MFPYFLCNDVVPELSSQYDIVIGLVPFRQGSELWTRELCGWREIQAIDGNADKVGGVRQEQGCEESFSRRAPDTLGHMVERGQEVMFACPQYNNASN